MRVISAEQFQWIQVNDYNEMSERAASIFEQQLQRKPESVLGFATGGSPIGFYQALTRRYQQGGFSFSEATSFNLDEYVGLAAHDETSYHRYMEKNLFNHIDLPVEKRNIPNGLAKDLMAECLRYEQAITESGGIDLQLLGIGVNGHIGFNEPGTSFRSRTHIIDLAEETRRENAKYFHAIEEVPTKAITMGIETIMNAKKILLLAYGAHKADAIERLKANVVSEEFPASVLRNHTDVTILYGK